MKVKDAICSGLAMATMFSGVALIGAFVALLGHEIGKEDGKLVAYADCAAQPSDLCDDCKTV